MKFLIAVSCLLAVAAAVPITDIAEVYLTEDTNGFYKFHIKSKAITRDEERDHDGKTVGGYTFVDPEGVQHELKYVAAADEGFTAHSADIPIEVPEGAELVSARSAHLARLAEAAALFPEGVPEEKPVPLEEVLAKLVVPQHATLPAEAIPEEDVENLEVKAQHFSEYAVALKRLADTYRSLQA